MIEDLCGIDEAGRGCCAGPLVVAGVVLHKDIKGLNDSKKLSPKKREELYDIIIQNSTYHIVFCDNNSIDDLGLSRCISDSLKEILQNIQATRYLFDGNTSFNVKNLEHQIKADESIAQVSAASILAKVSRDRYMIDIASKYPQYYFEKHKGYVTKLHIQMINEFGYSNIHRKSYKIKGVFKLK